MQARGLRGEPYPNVLAHPQKRKGRPRERSAPVPYAVACRLGEGWRGALGEQVDGDDQGRPRDTLPRCRHEFVGVVTVPEKHR